MDDDSHPPHTVISAQRSLFSNRLLLPGVNPAKLGTPLSLSYQTVQLYTLGGWRREAGGEDGEDETRVR